MGKVVKCFSFNVRMGASTKYPKIGSAAKGTRYAVLGTKGKWYKILFNGKTGYISKSYLSVSKETASQQSGITLTAASFNVHDLKYGATAAQVAAFIKKTKADVVGIQEIDQFVKRSGNKDWPASLAAQSGYPYYCFAPAITYDGGLYGTMILSRYPIIETGATKLDTAAGAEERVLAYARILTYHGAVCMFNTHLSYESDQAILTNLSSLGAKLTASGRDKYCGTGDFNTTPDVISKSLSGIGIADTGLPTEMSNAGVWGVIDNILYTQDVTVSDVSVKDAITGGVSDHNLVMARVLIKNKSGAADRRSCAVEGNISPNTYSSSSSSSFFAPSMTFCAMFAGASS
jgi:endonuclease/exonuclease/phosphatase family metal-dependent hydrolase